MDYVNPAELVRESVAAAVKKSKLSVSDILFRGALSGAILGFATSLTLIMGTQGLPGIAGAIAFPVGFVILTLLGLELVTGNFAILPQGVFAGQVTVTRLLRSWFWVYMANLIGSLLYAWLFYLAHTYLGTAESGVIGASVIALAEKKTLAYVAHGSAGWGAALVKAILCNWMVTMGSVMALVSRSTVGKIVAMWLPITIFYAHGYEHSVVNMYVIPAGMMLGAKIGFSQWLLWNQLPVTIGNIVGGVVFTGFALWVTYGRARADGPPAPANGSALVGAEVPAAGVQASARSVALGTVPGA